MDVKWTIGIWFGFAVLNMGIIWWFLKTTIKNITRDINKNKDDQLRREEEILRVINDLKSEVVKIKENIIEKYIDKMKDDINEIGAKVGKIETALKNNEIDL